MANESGSITRLLGSWRAGDAGAESALIAAVYPMLHELARKRLGRAGPMTFAATDLVHEAYMRLIEQKDMEFSNRSHFFAISAHVIRRVLVDHQRERMAQKRGGDDIRITFEAALDVAESTPALDILDIDRLLTRLERIRERAAKLVELRYFTGLSLEEAAEHLAISLATAKRDWHFARAWMQVQLQPQSPASS